jgi:hypothetical protein
MTRGGRGACGAFCRGLFKTYFNVRDPQAIEDRANAENPPRARHRRWVVSPDPQLHIERVTALFRDGATIVNIHSAKPTNAA